MLVCEKNIQIFVFFELEYVQTGHLCLCIRPAKLNFINNTIKAIALKYG